MTTKIYETEKPKLKNPIFIEGLPGIGQVGRISAGYLSEELKAKKFSELVSSSFMHYVLLHQSSSVHVLKNEFYYWKAKSNNQRDAIILIGDCQPIDPSGHYEVTHEILNYIKGFGVKDLITLGGWGVGEASKNPRVIGATNNPDLVKKYNGYNIDFDAGSKIGTIVGISGLLLGLGKYYGMNGICLLGETAGYPILPDPRAAEEVLKILMNILKVKIDTTKLEKKIKEMEGFIKKVEDVQKSALSQLIGQKPEKGSKDELTYIG